MKTQIIQLEQREDTVSVKDKMSWCHNGRILLVWPASGHTLKSELEITLIRRYAESLGCVLAFVCHDPDVKAISNKVGVMVFDDFHSAQEQSWKPTEQKRIERRPEYISHDLALPPYSIRHKIPKWMAHPVTRYACLGLSFMAIVLMAIFILPGAKIDIASQEKTQAVQLELFADPNLTSVNLSTGSIPVSTNEVVVESSFEISTTGVLAIPEQAASVSLVFTNNSLQALSLPPGTVVSTIGVNPVRFSTKNTFDLLINPKESKIVDAQALLPGSGGNLPDNSLKAIEGNLGLVLTVTNPKPTSGGTDMHIKSPDANDLERLNDQINNILITKAVGALQAQLADGDVLVLPSVKIVQTLDATSTPDIAEPGESLEGFQRARVQAQVVSRQSISSLVTPILDADLHEGYSVVPESLVITQISNQTPEPDGITHWLVNAARRVQASISPIQLAQSIRGKTIANAVEKLSDQVNIQDSIKVKLVPYWWPRLPLWSMRISFVLTKLQ